MARIPPFKEAVAFAQAVEEVTREEFLEAQRRVRPGASHKGYAEGLWQPWKAGGLLWLAGRADPPEVAEVYALVAVKASEFVREIDTEIDTEQRPTDEDLAELRTKFTGAAAWVHLGGQEMLLEVGKIMDALTPMSQEQTIMEIAKQLGRLRDPDVMVYECDLGDMGPDAE